MSAVPLLLASGRPGMATRGAGSRTFTDMPRRSWGPAVGWWVRLSPARQRGAEIGAVRWFQPARASPGRTPHPACRMHARCAGTPAGRLTCRASSPATKQRSLEMRTRQQPEESKGGPARANRPPDAALTTQAGRDRLEDDVRLGLDLGRRALDDLDLVRLDERDRLHLLGHGSDRHSVCYWCCCLLAVVGVGGKALAPPRRRQLISSTASSTQAQDARLAHLPT